jgi:hypothetical protein
MRVVVPSGVSCLNGVVDVQVATPYGVSAPLQIPVLCSNCASPPAPQPVVEGYSLDTTRVTVTYQKKMVGDRYLLDAPTIVPGTTVALKWNDALGTAPQQVKLTLQFACGSCPLQMNVVPQPLQASNGSYVLTADMLSLVLRDLFQKLNAFGPFTDASNPVARGLTTTAVKVLPIDVGRATTEVTLTAQFQLDFQPATTPPAAAPGSPIPTPPASSAAPGIEGPPVSIPVDGLTPSEPVPAAPPSMPPTPTPAGPMPPRPPRKS